MDAVPEEAPSLLRMQSWDERRPSRRVAMMKQKSVDGRGDIAAAMSEMRIGPASGESSGAAPETGELAPPIPVGRAAKRLWHALKLDLEGQKAAADGEFEVDSRMTPRQRALVAGGQSLRGSVSARERTGKSTKALTLAMARHRDSTTHRIVSVQRSARPLRTVKTRDDAEDEALARAKRTLWIGGIPSLSASENAVKLLMSKLGPVSSVHVRTKDGDSPKSWALVMFKKPDSAARACNVAHRKLCGAGVTADWRFELVEPSKLKSLEAQLTLGRVKHDAAAEMIVGRGEDKKKRKKAAVTPTPPKQKKVAGKQGTAVSKRLQFKQAAQSVNAAAAAAAAIRDFTGDELERPKHEAISLEEKLSAARSNNHKGEGDKNLMDMEVGDVVEFFTERNSSWVPVTVTAMNDKQVQIQFGADMSQKWVAIGSTDLRRQASEQLLSPRAGQEDFQVGGITISEQTARQQLTATVKLRARRALLRVPEVRTKESIRELVLWTYTCNMFSGLTLAQRRAICLAAEGVETAPSSTLVKVGDEAFGESLTIMFSGKVVMPIDYSSSSAYATAKHNSDDDDNPARIELGDGNGVMVDIPFHNMDLDLVRQKGVYVPQHKVTTLDTGTVTMIVRSDQHKSWLKQSYHADIEIKKKQLRDIPTYQNFSCLPALAALCTRTYHRADTVLVREGDRPSEVFYLVTGSVAVYKQHGTPQENMLNEIGRGSCIGDWGVKAKKLRTASCITASEAQVLVVRGVNFLSVVDESTKNGLPAEAKAEDAAEDEPAAAPTFRVISRRQRQLAGKAMLAATREMSQEDRVLGVSSIDSVGLKHKVAARNRMR